MPAPKVNTIDTTGDTTGAGDCFCGAFSVFQKTYPLNQAIERAIKASALAVTKPGAQSAMPYLDELSFD
ncbi:PfkB family carbohydrate kinase [Entomobacter blattae]|uniref:PfkB family carbohydrate kinase n=1 Tax=Entomobacter blattae TaxID=2762277 RepID=UPI00193BE00A